MGTEIRIRHTCLRVADLEQSVTFYTQMLGMDLMRRRESPERGETVAYVGYGEESSNHALELVQEHEPPKTYQHGNAYGHIALMVPDVGEMAERLLAAGVEFVLEPHFVRPGNPNRIAFFKDPDGYEIELTERK
ncbi:MAG: VOC family protein [Rhodospirillaceae bacterium]|jgi:lactoylglutathione lyase